MLVVVGRIVRAHGLRGEVVVELRTDEPESRFRPGATIRAGSRSLTIRSARAHGERLLLAFEEVSDRTEAEGLRGVVLEVEVNPADGPTEPGEFYDRQLVGLAVQDAGGHERGVVTGVLHLPSQDTLAIDIDGREVLVPFVADLVPTVDVAGGFLRVADVPGLLESE